MQIVIGNIVALVGSALMAYSGIIKEKPKILIVQTIQMLMLAISNIILGGVPGAIINSVNCVRNMLCYEEKLGFKEKIILVTISVSSSIYFNNLGIIGILPVIATVFYTMLMDMKNVIKFKILLIFTLILWGIYDLCIKSYTSAVFDLISIIANIFAIYKICILKNNKVKN